MCCFCYSTGSQRHDDGHRRGQQWDGHSGGMAEGRHEQHPFTCAAWTEGDIRNIPLQAKGPVCKVLKEALLTVCFTVWQTSLEQGQYCLMYVVIYLIILD